MHLRRPMVLIWTCFLLRLGFYALMLPLWEGYDEWAHFSVIRTMALKGKLLVARDQELPRDVAESLGLAPVPWELRGLQPPAVTQDIYWGLPAEERQQRQSAFQAMPAAWSREDSPVHLTAYEALQPPLYYWLMAPVVRLMSERSLPAQVMMLRLLSILIASLVIPAAYRIALLTLREERLAVCVAAIIAVMPGMALDVARVSNASLAVALFSLLLSLGLESRPGVRLGFVLGLGLLTKAYFLAALPVVALWLWYVYRGQDRRLRAVGMPLLLATLLSGWWYVRNVLDTGTLSGLHEAALLRDVDTFSALRRGLSLPWGKAVDSILFSHIYYGGWSSLMVRSWMYHLFYLVAGVAVVGLWRAARRPAIWWLLAMYAAFCVGLVHNTLLLYLSKGLPGSMGWYLYAVIGAEVTLCVAGLARLHVRAAAAGAVLFGLLDIYTIHWLAIPYYTGMIRHKANGSIAALHYLDARTVGFGEAIRRLAVFKGPWVSGPAVAASWVLYLAATAAIVFAALRSGRVNDKRFVDFDEGFRQ